MTTADEGSDVDQFFSNERRRGGHPVDEARSGDDVQPGDAAPPDDVPGAGQVPATADHGVAGWYPDADEPGLMRYWDGFHLTGQVLHVHARADDEEGVAQPPRSDDAGFVAHRRADDPPPPPDSELASSVEALPALNREDGVFLPPSLTLVESPSNGTPAVPESAPEAERSADRPVDDEEAQLDEPIIAEQDAAPTEELTDEPADELTDEPVDEQVDETGDEQVDEASDEVDRLLATADPERTDGHEESRQDRDVPAPEVRGQRVASVLGGTGVVGDARGEANRWAKEAEKAVARATTVGSPETWREAARLAVVVAEMTQTLQAAAEADKAAAQLADAAREAAQRARAAEQKSADATQAVQRAQRSAQEADDAARRARQTAVEAKEAAERASQAVPEYLEAEKVAAKAAADAQRKAQSLGEIVGTASRSDTAPAWSEALRLASAQVA